MVSRREKRRKDLTSGRKRGYWKTRKRVTTECGGYSTD